MLRILELEYRLKLIYFHILTFFFLVWKSLQTRTIKMENNSIECAATTLPNRNEMDADAEDERKKNGNENEVSLIH